MNNVMVFPIVLPFVTAATALLLRRKPAWQYRVSLIGAASHRVLCVTVLIIVTNSGIRALHVGGWKAPFGISLVADHLSALMLVVTGILGTATAVYAWGEMDMRLRSQGFHPLFYIMLGGLSGAFLTGDMFNLYVWFEVMLMASFGLLATHIRRDRCRAESCSAVQSNKTINDAGRLPSLHRAHKCPALYG